MPSTFMDSPSVRRVVALLVRPALAGQPSERFLVGPQVDFLGPGRLRLAMEVPVCLGYRFDAEQAVLASFADDFRATVTQAIAVDAAVDDGVCNMDAPWAVIARHALREHAQAGLGSGEMREAGLAAHAARRAGEQDRAASQRHQVARRLATHQESAEAAYPPEVFEHFGGQFEEIDLAVVTGVVNGEIDRIQSGSGRHGAGKCRHDIRFARYIGEHGFGAGPAGLDGLRHLLDLGGRPAGDDHVIALFREATAERSAESLFGADAEDDCNRFAHYLASREKNVIAEVLTPA